MKTNRTRLRRRRSTRIRHWKPCVERLESRLLLTTLETGDFVAEIARLKDLAFASGSNSYVAPTGQEQTDFNTLATTLLGRNVAAADSQAAALGYEVVEFTDTVSGDVYHGLREQLVGGQQTKGWGSYFVNLDFLADALVEIPHPLFDTNSWDVGAKSFRDADARGFLLAGAHRNANGTGTADVAHLTNSIFQEVHEAWVGAAAETDAWQVHGFNLANYPSFPAGTDAVLSNGDGTVSSEVIELDANLEASSFATYAYNTLAPTDPTNVTVNAGVDGTTFSGLAATTNEQGIYSRSLGGTFVHAELEQSIRFDANNRVAAATDISDALLAESSFVVSGSEIRSAGSSLNVTVDFDASVDAATLQAADLIVNGGTTATGVAVDDADTATFTITALAGGTHTLQIVAGTIAATDGTSLGAWSRSFDVASNNQYTINHSPRLQLGNAPLVGFAGSATDQVELLWQTMSAGGGSQDSFSVEFRLAGSTDPWAAAAATSQIPIPTGGRINHYTAMTGLSYDTQYEYRVRHLAADVIVDEYDATFRTRLPAGNQTTFSFAAYGDSADLNNIVAFRNVQARINAVDPAFAVLLGDNVYDTGTHAQSDARFDPTINPEAAAWTAGHIDYVAFGNHDIATDGGQAGEDNFSVPIPVAGVNAPAEPPASEPMEHNYSFDYGNIHFVTFDTNSLNNATRLNGQLSWIEADLAASTAQWKIVFGHHPVTGSPDKSESAADNYYQQVVPRLRTAGADVFLMGHSHTYHRSYPLLGQSGGVETYVLDTDNSYDKGAGLIQLVAGTGGKSLRSGTFTQYPFNAAGFSTSTNPAVEYGFAQFDVTPTQLTVSYIAADDGATLDQFTITAGPDTTAPSANLSIPQDNGPSDLDPAVDSILVTSTQPTFGIQLSDASGIDDATVTSATVSVTKDATPLVESTDYTFSYNTASDVITLTSLGGDFDHGVYAITLSGGGAKIDDSVGNSMSSTPLVVEIDTSVQIVSFQQGVGGYTSSADTMLQQASPSADNSAVSSLNVDSDDPGGTGQDVQALLRFDDVFGTNAGQIPPGATILSASLQLEVSNPGSALAVHRMLISWSDTDTWNSMSAGIAANDLEAVSVADATTGAVSTGLLQIDVTSSLASWLSNPAQNFGWAMLPTGGDGVDFDSAEGTAPPRLEVQFSVKPPKVIDVIIGSSGSANRSGVAELSLEFDQAVTVASATALRVYNHTTDSLIDISAATLQDNDTSQVTWNFSGVNFPDGRYTAELPATAATSGGGLPLASTHAFLFHVLAGDSSGNAEVDFSDFIDLTSNFNTIGGPIYGPGDLDGNGDVDFGDFTVLTSNFNHILPAPTLDFGDAPETGTSFPTTAANDGARHLLGSGLFLGAVVDGEADGQPEASAAGDDNTGNDEDGVTFDSLTAGSDADVTVVATAASSAVLNAWIDFNADGDWSDLGEQIFANTPLTDGGNALSFSIPAGAAVGDTFARFRVTTSAGYSFSGLAPDGEVEDYQVTILAAASSPIEMAPATRRYFRRVFQNRVAGRFSVSDTASIRIQTSPAKNDPSLSGPSEPTAMAVGDSATKAVASRRRHRPARHSSLEADLVDQVFAEGPLEETGDRLLGNDFGGLVRLPSVRRRNDTSGAG